MIEYDESAQIDVAAMTALCSEEEWPAVLAEHASAYAPRRFALLAILGDRVDAAIFGWGTAFTDRATVHWPDGTLVGLFPSAEHAWRRFSRLADLELVWLDAHPPASAAAPVVGS